MATYYTVLGQTAPSATTDTTLYTSPSGVQTVVSTIVVCNRSASARTYRIAVRPVGATIANQHYLAYDVAIAANDSTALTLGITLSETDVITVRASTADLSFTAFGSQIS